MPFERGSALRLPTPLARLYAMAMAGDIAVSDYDGDVPWPDSHIIALVAPGRVVLHSEIESDNLRTEVLAFSIALSVSIVVGDSAPTGHVATSDGIVLVTRERIEEPPRGPGRLAGMFVRQCGHQTASATFAIITDLRDC
jgi:hypothetical protein